MNDYKCIASQDGICRNIYARGIKCDGYSKKCSLRPCYNNFENVFRGIEKSIRNALGIVGDKDE